MIGRSTIPQKPRRPFETMQRIHEKRGTSKLSDEQLAQIAKEVAIESGEKLGKDGLPKRSGGKGMLAYDTCPLCGGEKQKRSKKCLACKEEGPPARTVLEPSRIPMAGGPPIEDGVDFFQEALHVPRLADFECPHGRLPDEPCDPCNARSHA